MTNPTHELNYKIEKIPSGYLGQCVEFPQVIVQAKTQPALNKKVGTAIEGYLKACPEIHKTLNKTIGYAKYEIKKA